MAYIEVDVDLDQFDTNDLISELVNRLKRSNVRLKKQVTKEDTEKIKKEIRGEFVELSDLIGGESIDGFELKTLDDKLKMEHLLQVWSKYSLSQIQYLLP